MPRVKRGVTSRAKHKKVLKAVKGQWGRRKNTIRVARQAMEKSMQYAYRDRRNKKREFKSLWIQRINAGVRAEGLTYAKFINGFQIWCLPSNSKSVFCSLFDGLAPFTSV